MHLHRGAAATVTSAALLLVGTTLTGPAPAAVVRCQGEPATIVGTRGADRIVGTRRRDVIAARGGNDRVDGARGADLVCGGNGADRLEGGRGPDRLHGGRDQRAEGPAGDYLVGDALIGGPNDDLLDGGADQRDVDQRRRPDTYSWADSPRAVVIELTGTTGGARGFGEDTIELGPAHRVLGSPYGDRITGSARADHVHGGDGADTITTRRGADRVFPDARAGNASRDTVDTGSGPDLVSSLAGRDRIRTRGGDDFVEAFSDSPTSVDLGAGDDYVGQHVTPGRGAATDGGADRDVIAFYGSLLRGQRPPARFVVDLRAGTTHATGDVVATGILTGFEEHRLLGPLRWIFLGTSRPDRVWAIQGGPLRARTYAGNDRLVGSDEADLLAGGSGTDHGDGNGGKDDCRSIERGRC